MRVKVQLCYWIPRLQALGETGHAFLEAGGIRGMLPRSLRRADGQEGDLGWWEDKLFEYTVAYEALKKEQEEKEAKEREAREKEKK